jgi:hypothetical protein
VYSNLPFWRKVSKELDRDGLLRNVIMKQA